MRGSGGVTERSNFRENTLKDDMMTTLTFKKLEIDDIIELKEYFRNCNYHISDYSAAFKAMWQNYFEMYFALVEGCLVFKEYFQGRVYFHYPMSLGSDECCAEHALDMLEEYCRGSNIRIHFTSVPAEKLCYLVKRYGTDLHITNKRRWRDYLYEAQDFVTFAGKKFSGQRNHINKFKRLYPQYTYCTLTDDDRDEIVKFLKEYEERQLAKGTMMAREEMQSAYNVLPYIGALGLSAGGLRIDGKLIAFSVGEVCGDQLIVHIEKALTSYEGVYPVMANEFARHNVTEEIKFINREDDSGDAGLRKSKLQYNPIALVDKYNVIPRRIIDGIAHLPQLKSERLVLKEIGDMYAVPFYRLEYDADRNKYWGYDWREHFSGEPTPEYFLRGIREDFKNKEEMPFGIFCKEEFVGEVVLHNFGCRNDCEIGVRLLPEFEGKGYAVESLLCLMRYAFYEIDIETITAKCFKANERSRKALLSAGMRPDGEDEVYFYFKKTAAM